MRTSQAEGVGQLLFITLDDHKWTSSCERLVRRYQPGGILLTKYNLRTPHETCKMLSKIAGVLETPPFLALAEEGGSVDPLQSFFPLLPSPRIAMLKGAKMVEELGSLIGEAFALLGFNMNFAPRLDLANPLVKPSLQPQSFSSDPEMVVQNGEAFISGLRRHKVISCGKHFPGLSGAEYSDGSPLPIVDKPMAGLWREDLMPYRQLLPRLGLVKVSYAAYKAYDHDLPTPASVSANVLEGLLRVKLGYRGIALVDFFEPLREREREHFASPSNDEGIMVFVGGEAVPKSISVGCDMLVVGFRDGFLEVAVDSLKKSIASGSLLKQRVSEAMKRIARAKKGLRLPTGRFSKRTFDRLCRGFEDFNKECRSAEQEIV